MNKLQDHRKDSYYFQCVMEANRDANTPFTIAEIGDYGKVTMLEDLIGQPLKKGMAYRIADIQGTQLTLVPLPIEEHSEYMSESALARLTEQDFVGSRKVERESLLLIKRVNVENLLLNREIHRRAYGTVNEDGHFKNRNMFISEECVPTRK